MPKPLAVVPDLETELDGLYELPPAEFTQARNDLARRLKQAGQAEAAAGVQQLRKPTVPVWTVNQLARRHGPEVAALLEAGERLRDAQRAALSVRESEKLRQATAEQRDALQALTHRAHDLLADQGQSPTSAVIERIASTLRAAAVDPASRKLLQTGRLNAELDPSGFGALAGMPIPAKARGRTAVKKRTKPPVDRKHKERVRELREQARQAEAAARDAQQEAERAEAAAARARSEADRARAELEEATERATRP